MVITLTGANSFELKRQLNQRVAAFLAEHDAIGLERIHGDEAEANKISEALTSLPFLADKKLVVLSGAAANKQFVEKAEKILPDVPDTTDVIIVEPKLDKRSSYYKYLKKTTEYQEFGELDSNGLARWASEEAKAAGATLSSSDARFLVERAGLNQQSLAHELEKLGMYDPAISRATIELLVETTAQSSVFDLLEAAFAGNMRRMMALYQEQRSLKVEPQQIIAMLAWQLHILAVVKAGGSRSPDTIAKEAKMSPYIVKKSAAIARTINLSQLKKLIADLLNIDRRLKRESLDADEVLQTYLLELAAS